MATLPRSRSASGFPMVTNTRSAAYGILPIRAAINKERREQPRLVIPQAALQIDQSGYYALVVDGEHKVVQRRVQTGPDLGSDVVITSGVQEGENVIVDGVQKVRPGQIVQEPAPPQAETDK